MTSYLDDPALWNWMSPIWFVVLALIATYLWMCRARLTARSWWFAVALMALLVAFVSPIGVLANGYLFSAHMVQHLLLLLVVPLCVLLSLPQERVAALTNHRFNFGSRRPMGMTILCWLAGLGTMWLWHVPSLCNAATQSETLGIVRSTSFLMAGLAFWWPIFSPKNRLRLSPPAAVTYLFSACLGCTLLGIYITFTTISVCPAFANPSDRIGILTMLYRAGLTPVADQQLGGLLMWVPPCSLYVCAIISVLCRWYTADELASISTATATGSSPQMTKVTS